MFSRKQPRQARISIYMITSSIILAVLTAAAIGIPAGWLVREQLNRQAWALVDQGAVTVQALLDAQVSNLQNLAILTAQRPTLQQLAQAGDPENLRAYLETLRSGAGLSAIAVCTSSGDLYAQAGGLSPAACQSTPAAHFDLLDEGSQQEAWILTSQPLLADNNGFKVVAGLRLDAAFASQLRSQTGLEQILLLDGQAVTASAPRGSDAWKAIQAGPTGSASRLTFTLEGTPYFAARFAAGDGGLEVVAALAVNDLAGVQRQLTWIVAGVILGAILLGSALGILRARHISRPLEALRDASEALRSGDLASPIAIQTNLRETALVAYALEDARIALQHSLNQLRQEKAWTDHLLDSVVEGILTIDRNSRITYSSQGASRILGWGPEEALGQSIDQVLQLADGEPPFSQQVPPPGRRQKFVVRLADQRLATLSITGAELAPPEAGKAVSVLVLRDVSDEEVIRRLLGDFLANIAHEFRTPLSALGASIELLLDQLPDLTAAELRELLNSTHLGVISLQTLIDNLLEGASIETGRFRVRPQKAQMETIIAEAVRTMQPLAEKYGQRLQVETAELPPVMADARRTAQVLVNLLSNAIKWGPSGGDVTIRAWLENDLVWVSVTDQGPGIPGEKQASLFQRFVHVQSKAARAEHGAGLGLSVIKAIVEAQGGEVGASNAKEGGAVFWFNVPLAKSLEPSGEGAG